MDYSTSRKPYEALFLDHRRFDLIGDTVVYHIDLIKKLIGLNDNQLVPAGMQNLRYLSREQIMSVIGIARTFRLVAADAVGTFAGQLFPNILFDDLEKITGGSLESHSIYSINVEKHLNDEKRACLIIDAKPHKLRERLLEIFHLGWKPTLINWCGPYRNGFEIPQVLADLSREGHHIAPDPHVNIEGLAILLPTTVSQVINAVLIHHALDSDGICRNCEKRRIAVRGRIEARRKRRKDGKREVSPPVIWRRRAAPPAPVKAAAAARPAPSAAVARRLDFDAMAPQQIAVVAPDPRVDSLNARFDDLIEIVKSLQQQIDFLHK